MNTDEHRFCDSSVFIRSIRIIRVQNHSCRFVYFVDHFPRRLRMNF
jgi:hypothetical protein